MALPFASNEWTLALSDGLNKSKAYKDAAAKWEGDLCLIVTGPGIHKDIYIYLDLWHGDCRKAHSAEATVPSEFTITAPLATWKEVVGGKLDPIRGLMTGKLKVKGPLAKILKSPKAAIELVNCAKALNTQWP